MKTDALTAHRFLEDRREAGLPVPTDAQIERARRAAVGQNRHLATPLGIVQLALQLPLTRRERIANRKGDGGVTLKPHRRPEPKASRQAVEAYLDGGNFADPGVAVDQIAAMAGYPDMREPLRRVSRYVRSGRGGKAPAHIRSQMSLLSAGSLVVELMAERSKALEA